MSSLVLKVSQLNAQLKALLESTFTNIMVEGEISTITYHSSGHLYFTIKDENASLKCVMWRSNVIKLPIRLKEGDHIVVSGNISLYSPRGEYQLIASKIEPFGKGILAIAFEELKKKLKEKGYFDESKKKKLPKFPKRVAVVTAKDSAALQDILKIAKKRWSLAEIIVVDTLVQGETAKYEIANAIKFADNLGCDIILVTRGGGSQEDLWAFNEEIVADAIYNASTPIVSAIGHEIDILISDFVADLRAPTPSGAAEMIFPDINEILFSLDELKENLNKRINSILAQKEREFLQNYEMIINLSPYKKVSKIENEFLKLKLSFREQMEYKISSFSFLIEKLPSDFIDKISYLFSLKTQELNRIKKSLLINSPSIKIDSFITIFMELKEKFKDLIRREIQTKEDLIAPLILEFNKKEEILLFKKMQELEAIKDRFKMLNPKDLLKEGYAQIVKDNKIVPLCTLKEKEIIKLIDGRCEAIVEVIEKRSI